MISWYPSGRLPTTFKKRLIFAGDGMTSLFIGLAGCARLAGLARLARLESLSVIRYLLSVFPFPISHFPFPISDYTIHNFGTCAVA